MTEEEARKTWCPFSRIISAIPTATKDGYRIQVGQAAHNRVVQADGEVMIAPHAASCLASKCAMWRWLAFEEFSGEVHGRPEGEGWHHVANMHGASYWKREKPTQGGYCGLAGKPLER